MSTSLVRFIVAPILLLALCAGLTGCPQPPAQVTVPNVFNLSQAQATAAITGAGLTVGAVTQQSSFTVPAGNVISQDPAANAVVDEGTAVALVVSSGPQIVEVPVLVGLTQAQAEAAIVAAGLTVGQITQQISRTVPLGQVISQDPAAGAGAPVGLAVTLVVSLGANAVNVPNVVGLTRAQAEAAIVAAGLTVGAVTEIFSDNVPGVLSQDPLANTPVLLGTAVDLVVSLGPVCNQIRVPDLSGLTIPQANLQLSNLSLGTITEAFSDTVARNTMISQDPAAGTCVAAGTAIAVVISLGPNPTPIDDFAELQKIGNDPAYPLDGNYIVSVDIDASASAKGAVGFTPIGTFDSPFVGRFNGNSRLITNLTINRPAEDAVGLFGVVGEAGAIGVAPVVENVAINATAVVGHDFVGSVCGFVAQGKVLNCHVAIPVTGEQSIGGLIGATSDGVLVDNCTSQNAVTSVTLGDIASQSDAIGGLVGLNRGTISNCNASGNVDGGPHGTSTGGLVGENLGFVSHCRATGDVTSPTSWIGGLIGLDEYGNAGSDNGNVHDCDARGNVTGGSEVGGLIGRTFGNRTFTVERCRALGSVTGIGICGGLIGRNIDTTVRECNAQGAVHAVFPDAGDIAGGLIGFHEVSIVDPPVEIRDCSGRGPVSGRLDVGGLIGATSLNSNQPTGPIVHCYASGAVNGIEQVGGLIGHVLPNDVPVLESFWDTEATGQATSAGGGTPATTLQMLTRTTFTAAGWDFDTIWFNDEGNNYPFLLRLPPL